MSKALNYIKDKLEFNEERSLEVEKEIIGKLSKLENIEEKLGIDLITLFEALNGSIYYRDDKGIIN